MNFLLPSSGKNTTSGLNWRVGQ